jgi:hypothetical protein
MTTSTAAVFALSALGVTMTSVWIYFAVFFFMLAVIFGMIAVVFRSIFDIIRYK